MYVLINLKTSLHNIDVIWVLEEEEEEECITQNWDQVLIRRGSGRQPDVATVYNRYIIVPGSTISREDELTEMCGGVHSKYS
jgi:hypothetical protein